MRKAFAIELDLPDNFTDAEVQLIHDALARIDRYIPGGARVVNVLPFEAWTGTALDPNQTDPLPPVAEPQSTTPPPSGGPVRVSTAAIPKLAGPLASEIGTLATLPAPENAEPTFLFPTGAPLGASPEPSGKPGEAGNESTQESEFLTLTIRRDILAAMAKGAYYEAAAEFYAAILAAMPADRQSVLISADDWV